MNDLPTLYLQVHVKGDWNTIAELEAGDVDYTNPFGAVADHSTVPTRIIEQYGEVEQSDLSEVLNNE